MEHKWIAPLGLACAAAAASLPLLWARPATADASGAVAGAVTIKKGDDAKADRSGVVVYLEGVGELPEGKPKVIHQRDLTFMPHVTVITKNTTIDFPNDDKVLHNVFSLSRPAKFDLGLYKSGTSKSVTFKRSGVVDVYCNIHPQMAAKIKVLDTPFYAVTGPNGAFRLSNVPAGTHKIVAWQAYGKEAWGEVTVTAGGAATINFELVEGERPEQHTRKDGTPYGRYQ